MSKLLAQKNDNKKLSCEKYIITGSILLLFILIALYLYYSTQGETKPDLLSETLILKEAGWVLGKEPNNMTVDDYRRVREIILGVSKIDSGVGYDQGSIFRLRDFNTNTLSDIKVLEKFTNLEHLYLQSIHWPDNKIPKWMRFLAKLGIIRLDKIFSIDLKPIEKLHYLRSLGIYDTSISNFESIRNVTSLERLILDSTNVSNFEPLKGLKNLKELEIRRCPNISERKIKDLQKNLPDLKITYER